MPLKPTEGNWILTEYDKGKGDMNDPKVAAYTFDTLRWLWHDRWLEPVPASVALGEDVGDKSIGRSSHLGIIRQPDDALRVGGRGAGTNPKPIVATTTKTPTTPIARCRVPGSSGLRMTKSSCLSTGSSNWVTIASKPSNTPTIKNFSATNSTMVRRIPTR